MLSLATANAQKSIDSLLQKHNKNGIPYIYPEVLKDSLNHFTVLDAREDYEYKVSHIPNAIHIGYNFFDVTAVIAMLPDKSTRIVVYCSMGIRSNTIGKKLKKAGYTNVFNLYGGIFEWRLKNYPLVNQKNVATKKVHVFSEEWSSYLNINEKTYE